MKIKKIIRFSFIYYNNFLQDLIYIKNSSQNKLKNCNIGYKISQQIQKMKKKGGIIQYFFIKFIVLFFQVGYIWLKIGYFIRKTQGQ